MRSELYDAVEEATRNEFEIVAELGGGTAWAAFLGRPLAGRGALAILLLQAAEDGEGEFDLETVEALDDGLPLGRTACPSCGAAGEGWPRFCTGCGTDLTGVPADAAVPGGSAGELLDEVREAAAGVYEVLGAMPHAEGGGALYFAREGGTGRVVGLALRYEAGGDLDLAVSWIPEARGEADVPAGAGRDDSIEVVPNPGPVDGAGDRDTRYPPRPFDPPPARARRRSREGMRRAAGIAALAVVALSLVAAVVFVIQAPPSPAVAGSPLGPGETGGPPVPAPSAASGEVIPSDPPVIPPSIPARSPAAGPETSASRAHVESPLAEQTRPTSASPPVASAPPPASVASAGSGTTPGASAEAGPAAAPTARGITEAVGRYAAAVQSRQTSRISRAYPGITPAEVDRWERFFRPLSPDAGLEARYDVLSGPTVNDTRGEILFTLTLSYTDASGRPAVVPLPLRGILEWTGSGWSLREVRSYP